MLLGKLKGYKIILGYHFCVEYALIEQIMRETAFAALTFFRSMCYNESYRKTGRDFKMIICKNCGKELDDNALFCTGCGHRVKTPEFPDTPNETAETAGAETSVPEENISEPSAEIPTASADEGDSVLITDDEPTATINTASSVISDNSDTIDLSGVVSPQQPYNGGNNGSFAYNSSEPQQSDGYQQQPYGYGQQNPEPQPAFKEKKPVKVGAGRLIGASVVAVFAMIFTLILSFVLCIKFGASGDIVKSRIEKLDLRTVLTAEYDGEEISNDLYKTLGFRTATDNAADETSFKEFMMNTNFLEYTGEKAKQYIDYIIGGEGSDPSVTSEDFVNDFFRNNDSAAREAFGSSFNDDTCDILVKNLDKEDFTSNMSIQEYNVGFVRYIFSYITIGILVALVIVLFIWIALIVDRKGRHLTGFYGNIFLVSGLIVFLSGVAVALGASVAYSFTSEIAFYLAANVLLPFALAALCLGFVELLIGYIFKKVKKSIKKKAKKAAEISAQA